jgi:mannose-6-phosphate isomerase-like protein (cupin superfamily)
MIEIAFGKGFMHMLHRRTKILLAASALAMTLPLPVVLAQPAPGPAAQAAPAPARGGRGGRGPAETWYIHKADKVVYTPPNRPIWRLADLLAMHRGQNNWSQPILKDDYQEVTYNSAAPGTKFIPRMHNETATVFFIIRGQVHFNVEGQAPVTATRGGIVNILNDTIYSYDVTGSENALFINLNPRGFRTEYPTSAPPPPPVAGTTVTKVSFNHRPGTYTGNNKLYFNLFDAIAKCQPTGGVVDEDHLFVNPLTGFVNTAEYTSKCPPGSPGRVRGGSASTAPFNPNSTFGHLHIGVREWWIVQAGAIQGRFEKTGEFHAVEGDVLNAEEDMWHQMGLEAPSGPSVRTAISAYHISNMGNTGGD